MSAEQVSTQEDLNKSIDALLDEVFSDEISKGSPLDLAEDSKTTADAAVSKAPSMQKDESRGAGRPKQISDAPQNDMDGRRESDYDSSIADAKKEDEPEEAKKQAQAIDQSSDKGHMSEKPKAPSMRPFKKSEDGSTEELSEEEYKEFQEFKKAKAVEADKAKQEEELKKAEVARKEQEDLVKSAVREATLQIVKENEELRKSFKETQDLLKAMASQPVRAKSITNIEALEKSIAPEDKQAETFTKSEILDAALDLAKAGKISDLVVSEIEMTNRCSDEEARAKIEKHLEGKK
jgi:hypothetical protein